MMLLYSTDLVAIADLGKLMYGVSSQVANDYS